MTTIRMWSAAVTIATALMLAAGGAVAQVKDSQHDLTATGAAQATTTATTEICVFCHTPHGSNTGVAAPLWNKSASAGPYTRYSSLGSATLDGTEAPVGSVSLACLSCHDGSQAMDVAWNSPGSGGYDNTGGTQIDSVAISFMVNTGPTATGIAMLDTDLRNDHPVSIAYAGGGCEGTAADCAPGLGVTGDPDFKTATYVTVNSQKSWYIDNTNGVPASIGLRDKGDIILYTRNDWTGVAVPGDEGPAVECGSCHDPHQGTAGRPLAGDPVNFLRMSNAGSAICLSCHIK